MEAMGEFSCQECSMAFWSFGLLEKHKEFFCVGSSIGDPVVLRQGHPYHRRDYPKALHTPDLITLREQRGMHLGTIQGPINDREQKAGKEPDLHSFVSDSVTLRNLTDEFHKLRVSIEKSNQPKRSTEKEDLDQGLERQRSHKERLSELAKRHNSQLAEIQDRNQLLEQQREQIARHLGAVTEQGTAVNLESLLLELREKEDKNEEALQQLRDHITNLQPVVKVIRSDSPKPEDRNGHHFSSDLISSVDEPLSTQIRILVQAYMQSGGSDPTVLAQMHDLLAEALTLEQQTEPMADSKGSRKRIKPPHWAVKSEILAVEQENHRLEEEIFRIQLARGKHCREDIAVVSELRQIQREHIHHMASIQAEIESLRWKIERATGGPRDLRVTPPPPLFPAMSNMSPLAQIQPGLHSSLRGRHVLDPLDSLGPVSYDPAAGFVVFFDLVLGVDAVLRVLRLVACLYSGGQALGLCSPLPPTQCQPGGNVPKGCSVPPGNYALLAVKQPMPRLQPSPSLSLVLELQAAEYSQSVQNLVSWGWAHLELFDQHNQVQSGYWRVPVRALPIRPSLSPDQLNSVQQVGNMEVCLRVVKAEDENRQSLTKIDPTNISQYKYLSLASNPPASCQDNASISTSIHPSTANPFPSSSLH
ncbi:coiled-coil domain-containing protein 17 [Esox lucius]|uniref:Coiled-coil domain containing 17 n=1 Tax=Esox lucius TaxID=8010 RepID=A0A6Q2XWB2_ESOLU|nr:coiled-coil domain-containing protein 17 [Esox lucius]